MRNLTKTFLVPALIVLTIILLAGLFIWKGQRLVVTTDKKNYASASTMKIKIKNYFLFQEACLSSCYPYFLQRKKAVDSLSAAGTTEHGVEWENYFYEECPYPDEIEKCIEPWKTRAFQTSLSDLLEGGIYRVVIPACRNCKVGEAFRATNRFFSSEFEIGPLVK